MQPPVRLANRRARQRSRISTHSCKALLTSANNNQRYHLKNSHQVNAYSNPDSFSQNTDYCFEEDAQEHANERCYGIVMDVIRGKFCTVLLQEPLTAETAVTMNIPGGRSTTIDLNRMQSITGETINSANGGNLIRLPWCKGLVPTSRLVASS